MLHRTEQEEATDRDQLEISKASRKMAENSTSCVTNGRNCLVSTFVPTCNNVRDGDDDNDIMEDLHVKCCLCFDECKCTNSLPINSNVSPFPTQRECNAAAHFGARRNGNYDQWITQHPSALENFKEIVEASEGKRIVMFLDYDGTLSPIVDDPDHAFMDEEMRDAVREVARCFPTAIVTGRSREKVYKFVKLDELYYAGSHGMDIRGPRNTNNKKGNSVLFQPAGKFLPVIREVYKLLVERTGSIPGAKVENNKFCLSVHFRCVDPQKWASLAEEVNTVITKYPNLRLTQGKKVLEIRPVMRWDKGKALEFLLQSLGYVDLAAVFPIYIGDDRSDEDAFKVLQQRRQGAGILVSNSPKDTNASYSLREPAEVMKFLLGLVRINKVTIN